MHANESLLLIRPRNGILRVHLTCGKQIWSLTHLLKPKDNENFLMRNSACKNV